MDISKLILFLTLLWGIPGYSAPTERGESQAGGYRIGDVVADFTLKNINGKQVSLADYKDKKGVVIVFTSNQCPFARAYEGRLIALDNRFAPEGFPVIAVNSGDASGNDAESLAGMQERAKLRGFPYPYLQDDTQKAARLFGASKMPQAYVLKNTGGKFSVQYIGAIDDNPQDPESVNKRYVEEALLNISQGRPVVTTTTRAIGCAIKFKTHR